MSRVSAPEAPSGSPSGPPSGLEAYIAVTVAYWSFMLTDGALRMLVLLHFHTLGFTPIQLAYLFILYEVAGIVTNLCAGWIAARFGLRATLYAGLTIQLIALIALTQLNPAWSVFYSVMFVMGVQGASGVAKDLTKMSSKSAVKLLAPNTSEGLFRWVAVLTGSKNAIKGLGFLLGASLLATLGFTHAIVAMAFGLAIVFVAVAIAMPPGLPGASKAAKFSDVFATSAKVNTLSIARLFLFGARDVWFVVGIPIYFYAVLSDGTAAGNRQAFFLIGTFMALWIILYGAVQGLSPRLLHAKHKAASELVRDSWRWACLLLGIPLCLSIIVAVVAAEPSPALTLVLLIGLLLFGAVFAVNSALHSYLILAFTQNDRVTLDVGFYYMANAGGRLLGTLLSGLTYQLGGLVLLLGTATVMVAISALAASQLIKYE